MLNVYVDPFSYEYLSKGLAERDLTNDAWFSSWQYLQEYCQKRGIRLQPIDLWDKKSATAEDVYVSFNHKAFLTKLFWRLRKNSNYPIVNLRDFKRKILFQGEPPNIHPEVHRKLANLAKAYDAIYLTGEVPHFHHYQTPRPYNHVVPQYWEKRDRKFLVMINGNKRARMFRRILMLVSRKRLHFDRDLIGERIKIIAFFSRYNEIDLYGYDWDKRPPFPYWLYKKAIHNAYKGTVPVKLQKLSEYIFALAPENHVARGFIGEALFDCFYAGTVPVYLGASDIEHYIPKRCFIDMRDFGSYEELRKFLKSVTAQEINAYRENARAFLESDAMQQFTKEHFAEVFVHAVTAHD